MLWMLYSSCQLRLVHLNNTMNDILTFKFDLCLESDLNSRKRSGLCETWELHTQVSLENP